MNVLPRSRMWIGGMYTSDKQLITHGDDYHVTDAGPTTMAAKTLCETFARPRELVGDRARGRRGEGGGDGGCIGAIG